jgi:hypothetical protein
MMGGGLAVACWFARDWFMAHFLKGAPSNTLLPVLVLIPCALLQTYFLGIAQAHQRFREYNIQQVVPNLLGLAGMTLVLVILKLGLIGAVLTHCAINIFMTVWLGVRIHRIAPLRFRVDTKLARDMVSFAEVVRPDAGRDAASTNRSVSDRVLSLAGSSRPLRRRRQHDEPADAGLGIDRTVLFRARRLDDRARARRRHAWRATRCFSRSPGPSPC